jgi:hypothetical protein
MRNGYANLEDLEAIREEYEMLKGEAAQRN